MTCCTFDPTAELAQLKAQAAAGTRPRLFPFFGHRATAPGVGPWVLSQWWAVPFTVDGLTYPHAESYMMAEKAKLFGDDAVRAKIVAGVSPAAAKALGKQVRGFDQATWDAHAFGIVVAGSTAKFSQHPALGAFLSSTGPRLLVEASTYDRIWGVGVAASNPAVANPLTWRGQNLLGFALTHVRDHHLRRPGA